MTAELRIPTREEKRREEKRREESRLGGNAM
jgi:hypothetical protein